MMFRKLILVYFTILVNTIHSIQFLQHALVYNRFIHITIQEYYIIYLYVCEQLFFQIVRFTLQFYRDDTMFYIGYIKFDLILLDTYHHHRFSPFNACLVAWHTFFLCVIKIKPFPYLFIPQQRCSQFTRELVIYNQNNGYFS